MPKDNEPARKGEILIDPAITKKIMNKSTMGGTALMTVLYKPENQEMKVPPYTRPSAIINPRIKPNGRAIAVTPMVTPVPSKMNLKLSRNISA
jgi:hypothetical protein